MPKSEWHNHWNGSSLVHGGRVVAKVRLVDLDFGYKAWEVGGNTFTKLAAAKRYAEQLVLLPEETQDE